MAVYCLLVFLLPSCSKKQQVIYPAYKSVTQSVYASGVIKTRGQYQVFSKTAGVLDNIFITEGDSVHVGQKLATISNGAASLNSAASQLAASYNAVQNNQARLQQLEYEIQAARQKKDNDSALYARQAALWQQGIGTRNELDLRQLNAKTSQAAYNSQVLQYRELQRQINFQASQASINVEISASQLNDLQVYSEVSGKVFSVLKKQGEMVTAQTPIAVVGKTDSFYMELQVDEYDIASIKTGQQLLITMDSYRGKVFEGRVTKIYPIMNDRSRTFTAEAIFANAPAVLYPNLSVEANIVITGKKSALLIPRSCLADDSTVALKNGGRKKVVTGLQDYQQVEIISGLTVNDAIIKPN